MSILTLLMIVGILAMLVFNFVLMRGGRAELERRASDDVHAAAAAEQARVDATQRLDALRQLVDLEAQANRLIEERVALRDRERAASEIAAPPRLDLAAQFEARGTEVASLSREMQQIYRSTGELGERLSGLPSHGDRNLDALLRRGLPNWWMRIAAALSRNDEADVVSRAGRAAGLQQALRVWLQRTATADAPSTAEMRVLIEIRDDLERIVRTARRIGAASPRPAFDTALDTAFEADEPVDETAVVEAVPARAARRRGARPAAVAGDDDDLAESGRR